MAQTPEEKKAKQKAYRDAHKAEIALQQKEYRKKNKDKINAAASARRQADPEKTREQSRKSHDKAVIAVGVGLLTGEEWDPKDEQFIRDNIGKLTIKEMAKQLNRSYDATATRIRIVQGKRPEKGSKTRDKNRFIGRRERESNEWASANSKHSNVRSVA